MKSTMGVIKSHMTRPLSQIKKGDRMKVIAFDWRSGESKLVIGRVITTTVYTPGDPVTVEAIRIEVPEFGEQVCFWYGKGWEFGYNFPG